MFLAMTDKRTPGRILYEARVDEMRRLESILHANQRTPFQDWDDLDGSDKRFEEILAAAVVRRCAQVADNRVKFNDECDKKVMGESLESRGEFRGRAIEAKYIYNKIMALIPSTILPLETNQS
jgi:hypothetical protein